MIVEDVMGKQLVTIKSVAMLPEAARTMRTENIGVLPVEDQGKLVGVITDRDITINAVSEGNIDRPVREVMTRNPITIRPDASPHEAINMMLLHNVRRLPVVDGTNLVGIVTLEDLVEAANDPDIVRALREFHHQTKHA